MGEAGCGSRRVVGIGADLDRPTAREHDPTCPGGGVAVEQLGVVVVRGRLGIVDAIPVDLATTGRRRDRLAAVVGTEQGPVLLDSGGDVAVTFDHGRCRSFIRAAGNSETHDSYEHECGGDEAHFGSPWWCLTPTLLALRPSVFRARTDSSQPERCNPKCDSDWVERALAG